MDVRSIGMSPQDAMVGLESSRLDKLGSIKKQSQDAKDIESIRKSAKEFEAIFLELVLKSMRNTVEKSELLDGGNAEDIFRQLLDGEYAKVMAEQNTTGISSSIENQLLSSMGKTVKTNPNIALRHYKDGG